MNKDVEEILKRFSNDFSTKEIRKEGYDKILNSEELVNSIQPIKGLTAPPLTRTAEGPSAYERGLWPVARDRAACWRYPR